MARHPRRPHPCERDFMPERCDMPPERLAKLTPCRSPTTGRNLRTETGAGETLPAAASLTRREAPAVRGRLQWGVRSGTGILAAPLGMAVLG